MALTFRKLQQHFAAEVSPIELRRVHDPETLESNVPNLYLAGAILGGRQIGKIFIENGRHHAAAIASAIERKGRLVTA